MATSGDPCKGDPRKETNETSDKTTWMIQNATSGGPFKDDPRKQTTSSQVLGPCKPFEISGRRILISTKMPTPLVTCSEFISFLGSPPPPVKKNKKSKKKTKSFTQEQKYSGFRQLEEKMAQ